MELLFVQVASLICTCLNARGHKINVTWSNLDLMGKSAPCAVFY